MLVLQRNNQERIEDKLSKFCAPNQDDNWCVRKSAATTSTSVTHRSYFATDGQRYRYVRDNRVFFDFGFEVR